MTTSKRNPSTRRAAGASESVVAGKRDSQKITPHTDHRQALSERDIYVGRNFLGVVRETAEGEFVAVIGGEVLGTYRSIRAATDAVIDTARPQVTP